MSAVWACENGHETEQDEGTGEPPLGCLLCGSAEWERVDA